MKPLALNISKMKKVAGDDKSTTFLHPDGHQMVIAHSGVSALQRNQLAKLPFHKMADGGDTSDGETLGSAIGYPGSPKPKPQQPKMMANGGDSTLPPELADIPQDNTPPDPHDAGGGYWQADPNSSAANNAGSFVGHTIGAGVSAAKNIASDIAKPALGAVGDFIKGAVGVNDANASIPPEAETGQSSAQPDAAPSQQAQPDQAPPSSPPPASGNFADAYAQGQRAIDEQAKIESAKAKANAEIQSQDLINRNSLNSDIQEHFQNFAGHQSDLMDDYAAGHIDPNHYMASMSDGQKAAAGIGLLLGGFASARTGHNAAMDVINKQIDRDIESQRANQDTKKTLLGANQALYHDQQITDNQTRVNMNDIYDHKIQLAASQQGTPQAKAAADAAHAQFAIQNNQLLQQNAIRAAVMGRMHQGGSGLSAIDLQNAGLIPPADADKEQKSIDAQKRAIANTTELFNKMDQEQTGMNYLNPQSKQRVAALNAQLVQTIMDASPSKRLTPESVKAEIEPFEIGTFNDPKTRQAKMAGVLRVIQQNADPTPYMSQYAPHSLPQYEQNSGAPASAQPVERIDRKSGKVALFNPQTKQFLGFK